MTKKPRHFFHYAAAGNDKGIDDFAFDTFINLPDQNIKLLYQFIQFCIAETELRKPVFPFLPILYRKRFLCHNHAPPFLHVI